MFDKLSAIESRYDELMAKLASEEMRSDPAEYRKTTKALSDLEPLVQTYREYKSLESDVSWPTRN